MVVHCDNEECKNCSNGCCQCGYLEIVDGECDSFEKLKEE